MCTANHSFGNGLVVKWKDRPGSCVLNYKDEAGKEVTKYITSGETNSYLLDFGSDLSYATYAVPESNAADTFYVAPAILDNYEDLRSILSTYKTQVHTRSTCSVLSTTVTADTIRWKWTVCQPIPYI